MTTIAYGLAALILIGIGAVVLIFPWMPGMPPGWVIVGLLFGVPMLGMAARRVFQRPDDDAS